MSVRYSPNGSPDRAAYATSEVAGLLASCMTAKVVKNVQYSELHAAFGKEPFVVGYLIAYGGEHIAH